MIFITSLVYFTLACGILAVISLFLSSERMTYVGKLLAIFSLVAGLALWQGWPFVPDYWFWWIDDKTLMDTAMGTIVVPAVWGPLFATLGTIALVVRSLKNRSKVNKPSN